MLPEFVEEDSDLPQPLNTASKQAKRAKTLAAAYLGKKAFRVQAPDVQGYFSRTQIVKMVGGDKIVIQFRIQPLDLECFKTARLLFGAVVPEVSQLHDEELEASGLTIYAMSYMPGQCWMHVPTFQVEKRFRTAQSLGAILGHGRVEDPSTEVVDNYIIPCLNRFRDSINQSTEVLREHVDRLIAESPKLKKLPLYFSHHDLNEMNVLVGKDGAVSGIVDWECAKALPFGMGLHRVTDTIVANNSEGKIEIPAGSKEAEAAFWKSVLRRAPAVVRDNLPDVQTALHIGTLTFAFTEKHLDDPGSYAGFLDALLTYRLPQLRGDAGPFVSKK